MCAETLWWRCHRRLIADALVSDGFAVRHLIDRAARCPAPDVDASRSATLGTTRRTGRAPHETASVPQAPWIEEMT